MQQFGYTINKMTKRKDIVSSDLRAFFERFFTLSNYMDRKMPKPTQMLYFLASKGIVTSERNKNLIAKFTWDFWNKNIILGLDMKKIDKFLIQHDNGRYKEKIS